MNKKLPSYASNLSILINIKKNIEKEDCKQNEKIDKLIKLCQNQIPIINYDYSTKKKFYYYRINASFSFTYTITCKCSDPTMEKVQTKQTPILYFEMITPKEIFKYENNEIILKEPLHANLPEVRIISDVKSIEIKTYETDIIYIPSEVNLTDIIETENFNKMCNSVLIPKDKNRTYECKTDECFILSWGMKGKREDALSYYDIVNNYPNLSYLDDLDRCFDFFDDTSGYHYYFCTYAVKDNLIYVYAVEEITEETPVGQIKELIKCLFKQNE